MNWTPYARITKEEDTKTNYQWVQRFEVFGIVTLKREYYVKKYSDKPMGFSKEQ